MEEDRSYESFRDSDVAEWRIEWDRDEEPQSRVTTMAAIAWIAHNYDDEAEVYPL